MREKLVFASTVTMGILMSMVFFVLLLMAYFVNTINLTALIGLTIVMNVIMWLVSPLVTDWMQGFCYQIRPVSFEEFKMAHPEVADFLEQAASRSSVPVPRLRLIEDANPTAYCYGSYPANARLVLSRGIFKYLTVEEQKAVVAHELGHIVNRDFIVMTIAVTLLQVLYEIYYSFLRRRRHRSSGKKDVTPMIGAISYVFYWIGSYLVLYLSRTREYLADRFSAEVTGNPDALAMALVKIAYGIAAQADTESSERLLASTRSLGISDYKSAQSMGLAYQQCAGTNQTASGQNLTKVFLFDLFSPWAAVSEISSTHPLTGRRVRALSEFAREKGLPSVFDFDQVMEEGGKLDQQKLRGGFVEGVSVYCMPWIAGLAGLVLFGMNPAWLPVLPGLLGLSLVLRGQYKFGFGSAGVPEKTTVLELMQDPYANPLKGRYVEVEGKVIGKADAGSYFGEDVKLHDRSGCLVYLNYESAIPVVGNLIFAFTRAGKLIGQKLNATGWFRRSSYQILDLDRLETENGPIRSYARFWELIMGMILLAGAVLLALVM